MSKRTKSQAPSKQLKKSDCSDDEVEENESGDIFFFYRPRVGPANSVDSSKKLVSSLNDVAKFIVILKPKGEHTLFREIVVGHKKLPDSSHKKDWAHVAFVGHTVDEMEVALDERVYDTKTRGERKMPAARPVAKGVYAIHRHEHGKHTAAAHKHTPLRLCYEIELPHVMGNVQNEFGIEKQGTMLMQVKNPHSGSKTDEEIHPLGLPPKLHPHLPKEVQEHFKGTRVKELAWAPDLAALDFEHTELLLMHGGHHDTGHQDDALDKHAHEKHAKEARAQIDTLLARDMSNHPHNALLKGEWV